MATGHLQDQPDAAVNVRLEHQLHRALEALEAIDDIGRDSTDAMAMGTTIASLAEALSYTPTLSSVQPRQGVLQLVGTTTGVFGRDELLDLAELLERLGDWREGNQGPHAPCPVSAGELLRRACALRALADTCR